MVRDARCLDLRAFLLAAAAWSTASCASTPRNPVLDSYPAGVEGRTTVTYYEIHGRTYAELHAEMQRLGPKTYGGSWVGETRSPMSWSWRTDATTGGSCSLRDVRVKVNAEILLPRWEPPADVDSSVVTEWRRFMAALETHEAGHKDISARAGREIKDQLRALTGMCALVNTRANDIARKVIDDANRAQKQYDAETQHGITQGTSFGAPSSLSRLRADSAAERVVRLIVTPDSLELAVGDIIPGVDLFRRLDVRGITAQGDTLRAFGRTFLVQQSELLVRRGQGYVALGAGDASVWVLLGSRPRLELRESPFAVRVPVHIR